MMSKLYRIFFNMKATWRSGRLILDHSESGMTCGQLTNRAVLLPVPFLCSTDSGWSSPERRRSRMVLNHSDFESMNMAIPRFFFFKCVKHRLTSKEYAYLPDVMSL